MWRLGIRNSYTMEATFGGSTLGEFICALYVLTFVFLYVHFSCMRISHLFELGDRRGTHFTTQDLKSLGFYFCDSLLDYCDPDPTKVREAACLIFSVQKQNIYLGAVFFKLDF